MNRCWQIFGCAGKSFGNFPFPCRSEFIWLLSTDMASSDNRTHEVTFCSRVSKWADALFAANPDWQFKKSDIEESKGIKRKRSDLRVYDADNRLILAGEVKLPGTPEGRNAYNSALERVK